MRVIVCGAGVVGTGIARQLAAEENDVTVIDNNPQMIARINDTLDVKAVLGFASHPTVLESAGIKGADMIIAVTQSDETNMIACQVAHSLFKTPTKIARIRDQSYLLPTYRELYRPGNLSIDHIISPEIEVAETIMQRFRVPGAMDSMPFADGTMRVIELRCVATSTLVNQPFSRVQQALTPYHGMLLALVREERVLMPNPSDILLGSDQMFIAVATECIPQAMALFGYLESDTHRVVLVGGGNIGTYLAESLMEEDADVRVTLIELSQDRAEHVAALLPKVRVLCGNALDEEILNEATVGDAEMLVAVSNDDEVNILCSLLSKRLGCKRAITLVNSMSLTPLVSTLGIDVTINPREATVSTILHHIRSGRIRAAHSIVGGTAEIIETEIVSTSPVLGETLEDLDLPTGIRIGLIARKGTIIVPEDDLIFQEKDRVLILCQTTHIKKLDKLFSTHNEYF